LAVAIVEVRSSKWPALVEADITDAAAERRKLGRLLLQGRGRLVWHSGTTTFRNQWPWAAL